jgi:hypothetical protein
MEEQQQAQAQQAQQQAQQAQQMDQAKITSMMIKAQLDQAKVSETYAKVDDLEAGAEHKRTSADLDIVKQMVELEDMDLANFRASLEMAEIIKLNAGSESKHPSFRPKEATQTQSPAMAGQGV